MRVIARTHLWILVKYGNYYKGPGLHLSLAKDAPEPRGAAPSQAGWWRCRVGGSITNTSARGVSHRANKRKAHLYRTR